ncbi:MAG: TraB/GumN family protein [Flavobacteriaceae bacterium]
MKKHKLLLAFLLMSTTAIFAQKLENSTLWKITGNGLEKPSYVFGTIHITCDATLSDQVKKALKETSQTILEIDMDDPSLQSTMMSNMMMTGGKSLKDFMSDEEYALVDTLFIKNMGMSVKPMQKVRPFFLSAMFYPKMIDCEMQSFETEIMKIAKEQGEDIKGLETIQDQLKVFEDIPYEEQVKDLVRTAKDNLAKDKKIFKKLMKIYESQNITKMYDFTFEDEDSYMSEHVDKLLDNRNKKWISRIGEFAKAEPTFFGVGAGHLAGKNGVILLLRKAGYTVTAVK